MKNISVGKSKIHNKGVFAEEDIKKGETILHIKGERKHKVNKSVEDVFSHPNWVGFSRHMWIDPEPPYKQLNHSCKPTAGIKGKVTLVALSNINKGEEITFDYSTTELDPRWKLESCTCGEKGCRKILGPIQSLPRDLIAKYLPYIPTAIIKTYQRVSGETTPNEKK